MPLEYASFLRRRLFGFWAFVRAALLVSSAMLAAGQGTAPRLPAFNPPIYDVPIMAGAVQPDGKLILSLTPASGPTLGPPLVRLNPDGSIDPTFNFGAYVAGPIRALLPLPDGGCIVAGPFTARTGSTTGNIFVTFLVKLNADGSLASDFARRPDMNGEILSLAMDRAGGILVAGGFTLNNPGRANLIRLQPSGAVDTGFNYQSDQPQINGWVQKVTALPDGRILIAGQFGQVRNMARNGVAVLKPDSTLDATFNYMGDHDCCITDALQQPDGAIVVAGTFRSFNGLPFPGLARLAPTGELDLRFKPLAASTAEVKAVAPFGPDRLLVSGTISRDSGTNSWTTVRVFNDGELDSAFEGAAAPAMAELFIANDHGPHYLVESFVGASGNTQYRLKRLAFEAASPTPPRIISPAATVHTFEGNPAVLAVDVMAEPRPSYQWLFNGVPLPGATNRLLQLSNVPSAAAGDYQLRVSNTLGTVTSPAQRLEVGPSLTRFGPGQLDVEFDAGTILQAEFISELNDGKLLLGGTFNSVQGLPRPKVAQLLASGAVDRDFVPQTSDLWYLTGLAPSTNGTVLVSGFLSPTPNGQPSKIVRLLADGSQDPSFPPLVTPGSGSFSIMLAHSSGYIYVAGSYDAVYGGVFRLKPDGSLDESYRPAIDGSPSQMLEAPDGSIVMMGWFNGIPGQDNPRLLRLKPDGTRDTSFFPAPIYTDTSPERMAIQSDGKIVLSDNFYGGGGWRGGGSIGPPESRLVRLNPDGSLDLTFGPDFPAQEQITALALQSTGEILVATGAFSHPDTPPGAIVRLLRDGTRDYGFEQTNVAPVLVLRPLSSQRVLVAGYFNRIGNVTRGGLAQLDASPGTPRAPIVLQSPASDQLPSGATLTLGGRFQALPRATYQWKWNGAELPGETNRTLTVRNVGPGQSGRYEVVVSNPLGSTTSAPAQIDVSPPDASPGSVDVGFYCGTGPNGAVNQLVELADGKVLIAGNFTAVDGRSRPRIARLNADGSLDETFAPAQGPNNEITSLVTLEDGRIVVGGPFDAIGTQARPFIATLGADGSLDRTNRIASDARITDLVLTSNGRIRGCGDGFVRGWNSNGSSDGSFRHFNCDGVVLALALQADGKLIFAGNFTLDGVVRQSIGRLTVEGSLDPTFKPSVGTDDRIDDIAVQSDGKIVIAGAFTGVNYVPSGRLARLNPDGSTDMSFATVPGAAGGRIVAIGHFGLRDVTSVQALAVTPDGRVLIGGEFTTYNRYPVGQFTRLYSDGIMDQTFDAGSGVASPTARQTAWYNEYGPFSSRWITRIQTGRDNRVYVLGNFGAIRRVDRPRLARLIGGDPPPGAPIAKNAIQNFDARAGTNLLLTARVIASPRPSYQWRHHGQPIIGATGAALELVNIGREAQGQYTCVVSNSFGTVEVITANINVAPPRISSGAVDTSFYADIDTGVPANSVSFEPDGKIILAGITPRFNTTPAPWAVRLNADGSPDLVWDTSGLTVHSVGGWRVSSLSDGGLLFSGPIEFTQHNSSYSFNWFKVGADGKIDLNFKPLLDVFEATSIARLRNGQILVACGRANSYGLIRLNSDGTLDRTFPENLAIEGQVAKLLEDAEGRIIVAGDFSRIAGVTRTRITRLTATGALDPAFDPALAPDGGVNGVALTPDGSMLIAGWFSYVNKKLCPRVAKLSKDGALDLSFQLSSEVGLQDADIQAIAATPEGRIFIAGNISLSADPAYRYRVLSINPDGSPDPTFDLGSGFLMTNSNGRWGIAAANLLLTPTEKLMIAGPFDAVDGLPRRQIARLHLGPPRLVLRPAALGAWQFAWDDGTIEQSSSILGPWTPVPEASSPWTLPREENRKFYRLRLDY